MKPFFAIACLAVCAYAQVLDQQTNKENMIWKRGSVPVARGSNPLTLWGTLFDAACRDRSAMNLAAPPETLAASVPAQTPAEAGAAKDKSNRDASSAHGISVDAATIAAERADILPHLVPDLRTRQSDPTCALSAATTAYAVVLDDGRVLNLDAGGNTFAAEAVFSSSQGRSMLNGQAYGFKPRVKIDGQIRGDRLVVHHLGIT